jgi:hypothetical protein
MTACLATARLSVATIARGQRQRRRQADQQHSRQSEHTYGYLFHDGSPFVNFSI